MRTRLLADETALADYEILEMLLFLGIARKDTKPLAKGLINEFGSLSAKQQEELITAAAAPETDASLTHPGFATYRLIKEMTVGAFYTSRVGLVDVLEYKGIAYLTEFPACTHPEHQRV